MRVIKPATIKAYAMRHRDAREALSQWLKAIEVAQWKSIQEVRHAFPHADAVRVASGSVVTVFNIKGNAYRLIVAIHYNTGKVFIREFMTHAQYDNQEWRQRH